MRVGDLVRLSAEPRNLHDLSSHILGRAIGRRILNVGAAGGVENYLPGQESLWLHSRLFSVASEVVGVDIDEAAIAHAARHGWRILREDCETMRLGYESFDLALMIDVVEHVEAPAYAIKNILRHLAPGGQLLITTPNPSFIGDIWRHLRGRSSSIYWDHQFVLAPEHLQAICDRHQLRLEEVHFFSHRDQRTLRNKFVSHLIANIGRLNLRLNSSWLGVVTK